MFIDDTELGYFPADAFQPWFNWEWYTTMRLIYR